jgi:hypothetical protein
MRRLPAVALWRTSAVLAALALIAAGCGAAEHAAQTQSTPKPAGRAQLTATGQKPLTVTGTGFQAHEKVTVVAKGMQSQRVSTQADSSGSFEATFSKINSCDSITVTATGSKGSKAEFNLSQIVCMGS